MSRVATNGRAYVPVRKPKLDYVIPDFGDLWEPELTVLPSGRAVVEVEIWPELAVKMLTCNREDNRNIRKRMIGKYADDIRCGRWELTHQAIAFDVKGNLCDGQHRLSGCVEAGKPFWSVVWFGIGNHMEMAVTDTGASRSAADASQYLVGERVGHEVIATLRGFLTGVATTKPAYTHAYIMEQLDRHLPIVMFHNTAFRVSGSRRPSAPVRATICRAYYHADRYDLIRFAGLITERIDPSESRDRSVKLLRRLIGSTSFTGGMAQHELYCKSQRALMAYLNGETLDKLYAVHEDLFPLPTDEQIADRSRLEDEIAARTNTVSEY